MLIFLAFLASLLTGIVTAALQPNPVPIHLIALFVVNGTICASFLLRWLFEKIDAFDPLGFLGLFGLIYFEISPIVQIGNDYWPFLDPLTHESEWIALWAILNTIGLLIFVTVVEASPQRPQVRPKLWIIKLSVFRALCLGAMAVAVIMQVYIFVRFGGVSGLISTYSARQAEQLGRTADDPFSGLGMPMLIAESFKYVFAMYIMTYARQIKASRTFMFFAVLMLVFFVVFLIFGGLRGSRSSTVFSLFFAAGMYHFCIRKIRVKTILIGAVFSFAFLNVYYWYKIAGSDGLSAIFDASERAQFSDVRRDNDIYVLSRDLGRMDVQTLGMIRRHDGDMPLTWGKTYLDSPFTIIPRAIIPWKPDTLMEAKNVISNRGNFQNDSTIVIGLFGEAFLNFGYLGIPVAFLALGAITRKIRPFANNLHSSDVRRFILPVFCLVPVLLVLEDAGLMVMILARALLIPIVIIFLGLWLTGMHKRPQAMGRSPAYMEPFPTVNRNGK